MGETSSTANSQINLAVHKFFICELRYVVYNELVNKWELKVNGRDVPVGVVWLHGHFEKRADARPNLRRFCDFSGSADVWIGPQDEPHLSTLVHQGDQQYLQLLAEIEDVNGGEVSLKPKKLAKLDSNIDRKILEDLWRAEVFEYHDFLQQSSITK